MIKMCCIEDCGAFCFTPVTVVELAIGIPFALYLTWRFAAWMI